MIDFVMPPLIATQNNLGLRLKAKRGDMGNPTPGVSADAGGQTNAPSSPMGSDGSSERTTLQELSTAIGSSFARVARAFTVETRFVRVAMIIGGAALAGIGQFVKPPDGVPLDQIFGFTGITLSLVGGIWTAIVERVAPESLENARVALEEAVRVRTEVQLARSTLDAQARQQAERQQWLADLYVTERVLREFVEAGLATKKTSSPDMYQKLLELSCRQLTGLLGFVGGEYWTFAIYQCVPDGNGRSILKCMSRQRAYRSTDQQKQKHWELGEGIVGHVQMTNREIIIEDTLDERASWLYLPNRDPAKDAEKYRSLAAVPVRVAKDSISVTDPPAPPWGVIVATSDRPKRFQADSRGFAQRVEPLRLLAGAVALAAAATYVVRPGSNP